MPQTEAFLVNKGKTWSGWVNRLEKSKIQYNFCLLLVSNTLLFSCKVVSDSWPQGLQHTRLPCPSPSPRAYSNSCPLSLWCHTTNSSSVVPFPSCLQHFPASRSFPMRKFFISCGQRIGASASASVLPMNITGWFSLGLTGLTSFQSKEPSGVFSNIKKHHFDVQKHQFFGAQLTLWSNSYIYTWLLQKP